MSGGRGAGDEAQEPPPFFTRLPHLVALDLSHNRLSSLPGGIGTLSRLEVLSVAHNRLASLPASFGSANGALTHLDVSHNALAYPLPRAFARLPVEYLNVARNAGLAAAAGVVRGRSMVELAWALAGSPMTS